VFVRVKIINDTAIPVCTLPCGTRFFEYRRTTHFINESVCPRLSPFHDERSSIATDDAGNFAGEKEEEFADDEFTFCDDEDGVVSLVDSEDYVITDVLSPSKMVDCYGFVADMDIMLGAQPNSAKQLLGRKDLMIADTSASCHIFTMADWMINVAPNEDAMRGIHVGGASVVRHDGIGELPVTFKNKDGKTLARVQLKDVRLAANFGLNLFSLTKAMKLGWSIQSSANQKALIVSKERVEIFFDVVIETGNGGMLLCAQIASHKPPPTDVAAIAPTQPGTKMSLIKAHRLFGHPNEDMTRLIAKNLGIEISRGKVLKCEDCTISKAKQKNLPTRDDDENLPSTKGQLLHLDLMSVKIPKGFTLHKNQVCLVVDAYTRMQFVDCFPRKGDMPDATCRLFQKLREQSVKIKFLRMDNSGENNALAKLLKSDRWKHPVEIQFTARDTPQQNSLVETAFASDTRRAVALFVAAKIPKEWRY
jgi:hypothetical protein